MLSVGVKNFDPQLKLKLPSTLFKEDSFVQTRCLETKPTSSASYQSRFPHSLKTAERQFFLRCLISRIPHLEEKKEEDSALWEDTWILVLLAILFT